MDPQVSCGGGIDVVESWSRKAYDLIVDHQEVVVVKFPTLHPKMHVGAGLVDLNASSS
jgi:hypothetical protein